MRKSLPAPQKPVFRMTPLRRALLTVLESAHTPLSVPTLERRLDALYNGVNKTTVYRNLELFEQSGLVTKTVVNEGAQYYESTALGHHHHFICTRCDTMKDMNLSDHSLIREAERLGKKFGFIVNRHAIEFYGECERCFRKVTTKRV